jgi:hypothetical protein
LTQGTPNGLCLSLPGLGIGEAQALLGVAANPNDKWRGGGGGAGIGGGAETLLDSRSGRIHLFPAVLPSSEVAFRNFQASGGVCCPKFRRRLLR